MNGQARNKQLWYSSLHRAPFRFCGSYGFISCRGFFIFVSLTVLFFFFFFFLCSALATYPGYERFFPRMWWGHWAVPWCLPQADISSAKDPGVLPYRSCIGMCRPIGEGCWAVLVWKWVYTLPILVWNRVWFRGNYGAYERIYRFNSKWVRKEKNYANSKWIGILFLLALISKLVIT